MANAKVYSKREVVDKKREAESNDYSDILTVYSYPEKAKQSHSTNESDTDGNMTEMQELDANYESLYTKPGNPYEDIKQTRMNEAAETNGARPVVYIREQNAVSSISDSSARRRFNPLYDANATRIVSRNSLPTKPRDSAEDRRTFDYLRYVFVLAVVLFVVAGASLAMSLYLLVKDSRNESRPATVAVPAPVTDAVRAPLDNNVTDIRRKLMELQQEHDALSFYLSRDIKDLQSDLRLLTQQCTELGEKMTTSVRNLSSDIGDAHTNIDDFSLLFADNLTEIRAEWGTYRDTMDARVANISKMSGPRGAAGESGVADFSQCFYKDVSEINTLRVVADHYTDWAPDPPLLKNYTVVGAGCSVDGGTTHNLYTSHVVREGRQYRCGCGGIIPSVIRRICTLHLWICPTFT